MRDKGVIGTGYRKHIKNWLRQKYSWWRLMCFFCTGLIKKSVKSIMCLSEYDVPGAMHWFREAADTYFCIKIHITYKSKRIK